MNKPAELSVVPSADGLSHIALTGRLDSVGVEKIRTSFQAASVDRGRHTIIDLSRVDFIASLGLGMLLSAARGLHQRGARAVIVNPQPLVFRVLEASHMPSVIPVMSTVSEAESFLLD